MFPTLRKELHKYVPAKFDDYKLRYTTNEGAPGFFIPDFDIAGEYDAKRSNLDEDLYMHKINQHRRKKLIVLDDDEKDDDTGACLRVLRCKRERPAQQRSPLAWRGAAV